MIKFAQIYKFNAICGLRTTSKHFHWFTSNQFAATQRQELPPEATQNIKSCCLHVDEVVEESCLEVKVAIKRDVLQNLK